MRKIQLTPNDSAFLFSGKTYMVYGWISDFSLDNLDSRLTYLDLKDGRCYADDDGNLWVYQKIMPKHNGYIPWFSIDDKDEPKLVFSEIHVKEVKEAFNVNNVKNFSKDFIIETTKENEQLYDEDVLNSMNAATSVYTPKINDDDDFLKKIVKKFLISSKVNINQLQPKMQKKYTLVNMRSALQNATKTSTKVFSMWMELLHGDFIIVVKDNTKDKNKMTGYIVYDSKTNKVEKKDKLNDDLFK